MGALIPILIRIISQVFITAVVGSLSFFGFENSTSTPWLSNSLKLDYPIIVNIEDKNITTPKTIAVETVATSTKNTTQKGKDKKNKAQTTTTQAKFIPIETPKEIQVPTTNIPNPISNPSLSNLPVPSIPIPEPSTVNSDLGEWNLAHNVSNESVVNILCLSSKGNSITVSIGSGVIIGTQGLILTNAHVAQTFLLPNQDCTIRQGEIASDKYKASLVYINENWLRKNASNIFSSTAQGTGENDIALLLVTQPIKKSDSISNINFANYRQDEMRQGEKGSGVLVAAYPGGTLGALSLRKYLTFVYDTMKISNVYTLDGRHTDIIETEVTKVGQHGSSGGGIFNKEGKLIGLIVSVNTNSNSSSINALSLPYINRSIKNDSGKSLDDFINTDRTTLLTSFLLKQNSLFEYLKPYVK